MQVTKGQVITVKIKEIAFGGDAVGLPLDEALKGYITFIKGIVLPTETAEVRITRVKKNFLEAEVVQVTSTSADRDTPRCVHFGSCGGCSLQHLSYEKQLETKDGFVRDALIKFGGFSAEYIAEVKKPIIGCDSPWYYRNKSEFTFEDKNPFKENQLENYAGFHPRGDFRSVFEMQECFLQSELAVAILKAVREWARENKIPFYNSKTHTGVMKNLFVREGKNTGEVLVNLMTTANEFKYDDAFAQMILEKFPQVTSIYRTGVRVERGFKTAQNENLLWGKPTLTETLTVDNHTLSFDILPQAFFQPNTVQAQRLYQEAITGARPGVNDHVLDLFCGTGTIGMFCARTASHVTGIDVSESAIQNAQKNATDNGVTNMQFYVGDTGKQLSKIQQVAQTATILITDPPRNGIEPKTLEKIIALNVPRWVYVSCNPTTLSRDLKIICSTSLPNGKKYKLTYVRPVDMFPQTYHVETVTVLEQA